MVISRFSPKKSKETEKSAGIRAKTKEPFSDSAETLALKGKKKPAAAGFAPAKSAGRRVLVLYLFYHYLIPMYSNSYVKDLVPSDL